VGNCRYLLRLHGAKRWPFAPRAGGERHRRPRRACQADHSLERQLERTGSRGRTAAVAATNERTARVLSLRLNSFLFRH